MIFFKENSKQRILLNGVRGCAVAGLLIAVAAGCQYLAKKMRGGVELSGFSHAAHKKPSCGRCHKQTEGMPRPSFPSRKRCVRCHDEEDDVERLRQFFGNDQETGMWASAGRQSGEIVFDHAAHAEREGIACRRCHEDVATASSILSTMKMRMAECMDCHRRDAPKRLGCANCHKQLSKKTTPGSHSSGWMARHGDHWRMRSQAKTADRCTLCHTQGSCDDCHQTERPRSHNNYWKGRGHGVASGIDRSRCAVCHQRDVCDRCHSQTRPRSHAGAFGSPTNSHCNRCHWPVSTRESCGVCHAETPSHLTPPLK